MTKKTTKTVTQDALVKRINRKLAAKDEALRKTRSSDETSLGAFYLIETDRNVVAASHLDISDVINLAREVDVIADDEAVTGSK